MGGFNKGTNSWIQNSHSCMHRVLSMECHSMCLRAPAHLCSCKSGPVVYVGRGSGRAFCSVPDLTRANATAATDLQCVFVFTTKGSCLLLRTFAALINTFVAGVTSPNPGVAAYGFRGLRTWRLRRLGYFSAVLGD